MLTPEKARAELTLAAGMNPGPWEGHSLSVAENARLIAEKAGLDSERAYVFGLLHDIGRRAGVKGIAHIFDGYDYLTEMGEPEAARICLTHSFPLQDADTFVGKYDCTSEQKEFLAGFLKSCDYDDYARLIQLCDAVSLPGGACIMEKRLVDVALRHGLPAFTLDKWRAFLEIKKHFDALCGYSIYDFLPNVLENSSADLI